MIKIENNRFTSNGKTTKGSFVRIKDIEVDEVDFTIADCIFEKKDDAVVGVEYTMKDGIRLFYENANGSTNEFREFAIVPTEKFLWMESQMHWHRFKNWVGSILSELGILNRRKSNGK